MRIGVVLVAAGEPATLADIPRHVARLAAPGQVGRALEAQLAERLRMAGGASPLAAHTERQRAGLAVALKRRGLDVPVHSAMRSGGPSIADAIAALSAAGMHGAIVLGLGPQFSTATICPDCRSAAAAAARIQADGGAFGVQVVRDWHAEPRLLSALASATYEALDAVWSAGSSDRPNVDWALGSKVDTPVIFVAPDRPAGAGHDPYRSLVAETAGFVAERIGLPLWSVAFTGAGPLGAPTGDAGAPATASNPAAAGDLAGALRDIAARGERSLVVCPVGSVADDLAVLYDVDVQAAALARELGLSLERARSLNDDPQLIAALADVVARRLAAIGGGN